MKRLFLSFFALLSSVGLFAQGAGAHELSMASFNVRNGIGALGVSDLEFTARVIRDMGVDVIALQELDSVTKRSSSVDVLRELALNSAMYATFGAAIDYDGGRYGIGILSKEMPLAVRRVPLPGSEEARMLLIAEFEGYVFASTHFSLTPDDQMRSVDILLREAATYDKPFFVGGDFNFEPQSEQFAAMLQGFTPLSDSAKFTAPSDAPSLCIDYIFAYNRVVKSGYALLGRYLVDEPLVSDHLPLVATVRLKTPSDDIFTSLPYLQNPVGGGVTVTWTTSVPALSWVEYKGGDGVVQKILPLLDGQAVASGTINKVRLDGLESGVEYSYRVRSAEVLLYRAYSKQFGDTVSSAWYDFELPAVDDSDFTVLIFNDLHQRKATFDSLLVAVAGVDYDFAFFNGDCIDDPTDAAQVISTLNHFNEGVGASSKPVFYLRGNHEIRGAYSVPLRDHFDYVGDRTYGAFSWGDTRFVMLDCGEDKPDSHPVYYGMNDFSALRLAQVEFLESELVSSDFRDAQRRILIHHIPIFGSEHFNEFSLELWGDLISSAPFDLGINGHTHRFKFYDKGDSGVPFTTVVGGGYSLNDATIMVLSKEGEVLTLRVLNSSGDVILSRVL